jgi:ADP-ribose pyrophosphatase YjhB (NUDIX family)
MKDIPTTDIDLSHHIQRQIMMRLRQDGDQSYQALKPDGVEGNAFNYHLRSLKQAGLIDSNDAVYSLTPTGHLVADGFSSPVARLMMRPYAHTALLVTSGTKILLYKATRQPLRDVYCLPTGKMRYGDDLQTSVAREAERRAIVGDYTARSLCLINIRFLRDGQTVTHRPGNLWHLEYTGLLEQSVTQNGTADWFERADIATIGKVAPDVIEGLRRLDTNSHNPIDLEWEITG